MTIVHCPECGAITRETQDCDDDRVLVCTDDDCPRIIVSVLSRPAEGDE